MLDREKVIKGLECCLPITTKNGFADCNNCPYDRKITLDNWIHDCQHDLMSDALAMLLKAQEPKLIHVTADINHRKIGECPNCGKMINSGDYPNYCGRCGQAVKWDG